jgi:hypothetical protein
MPSSTAPPTSTAPLASKKPPTAPGGSGSKNPDPPLDRKVYAKIRKYVQHDPVVRCGIPDPQLLKSVREYWSTRRGDVIKSFRPRGQAAAPRQHMLKNRTQAFIRKLLKVSCIIVSVSLFRSIRSSSFHLVSLSTTYRVQIEFDLAEAGYCFSKLTPSTFVVDEFTGVPLISTEAVGDIVAFNRAQREAMVGENYKFLADVIDDDIIGADNPMPEEVEEGLLRMMREEGYRRRYVIVNHVSLVPIANRLDLNLRMFQHLYDTIAKLDKKKRDWVQGELKFPRDWHTQVKNNRYRAYLSANLLITTISFSIVPICSLSSFRADVFIVVFCFCAD